MRKVFALLAISLGMASLVNAQTKKGKINGSIKDGSQKNLQSTTITLLKAKDSSSVKFAVANKNGEYEFVNISEGKYIVSVTSVGYEKVFSAVFEITEALSEINLGVMTLAEKSRSLGEVTVTAKKPFIETKIDKTVVNVEASPTSAGATALEI